MAYIPPRRVMTEDDRMQVLSRNMLLNEEEALFTIARELSLQEEALTSAWTHDDDYETLDALNLMEELLLESRALSPSIDERGTSTTTATTTTTTTTTSSSISSSSITTPTFR